jgi:uncharacterized membrane protein
MTQHTPPSRRGLFAGLRASFLTGLVIVAPAVVTIWLVVTVVEFIDNTVVPLIPRAILPEELLSVNFPGMGVVIFVIFTLLVGWLAKGYIGRSLIEWSEQIVARMPVVRSIYNAIKQIAETVFAQSNTSFNRACIVQYPRPGMWAIAFVATEARGEIAQRLGSATTHVSIFLPTTPNPTSGFLLFLPESDVIYLDMSVEEAAKLIISAGLVVPEHVLPDPASSSVQKYPRG